MTMADEFWRFSLALYGRPNVPESCLRLQDECGADVNLVLFLLWRAARGRESTPAAIAAAMAAVSPWQARVVRPLREVRRWMKTGGLGETSNEAFRDRVKALELEAERHQQAALAALPPGGEAKHGDFPGAARAALAHYAAALPARFPEAAVETLIDAAEELAANPWEG